jgi:hypothetical protein
MTATVIGMEDASNPEHTRVPWLGFVLSAAIYAVFAGIVFVVHGPEPSLNIDHLAYLRLADDIRWQHPAGDYWRSTTQVQSYGVLLAYMYWFTASHVLSLKLCLAVMTVASLLAFELFIGLVTNEKWKAVAMTLLSASFVSFGASFWGYTDFSASLNRTALIPVTLLMAWLYLAAGERPVKFAVFPLLTLASLVHLSAYYAAAILALVELWSWGVNRRFRLDRRLLWFLAGVAAMFLVREGLKLLSVDNTIMLHKLVIPDEPKLMLPADEAWRIELFAFPWRNMPLPLTTLAMMALSYGLILAVAAASAFRLWRRDQLTVLDRTMLVLAGAVVCFAYGPQTLLWAARQFLGVYPFGIEEVRAINLIMIPSLYFVFRMLDALWSSERRIAAVLMAIAILAQPLAVLRALPVEARELVVKAARASGVIRAGDSLRLLYARQTLGLENAGPRFYYSALGVVRWLQGHAERGAPVVTTLNEALLADVTAVGAFNGLLNKPIGDPARKRWAESVEEVSAAIASGQVEQVQAVARKYDARFAVVPWSVPGAAYRDENYSIIRVGS